MIGGRDANLAIMLEFLAIPAFNTRPTSVDDWAARLAEFAGPVAVDRDSPSAAWLEVGSLRLRGYVLIENGHATAVNFEVHGHDNEAAIRAIEDAAGALRWEVYPDDDEDEEADDDDDRDDQDD